ncbi:12105_t:CDS:2 [Funneliformis caledonium]|uniref:12105_t:CDS:1 n=1 Tax=Funneliformis caledonium TaxID=1117310 RepID=A0A9N8WSC5_9GLOM|nr:12105_t:CDS:2 [Funneliformis caledonium]
MPNILPGTPTVIDTNFKQSSLNNHTFGSSISFNNKVDIIQFVHLLKNEDLNTVKLFLSTHNYCTTIINTLEFKDYLLEHLSSSTAFDMELFNKANGILYDHLIQLTDIKTQDLVKFNEEYIQASLKHNLHRTDPQVLNLYNELSCKGKSLCPNLDLFCIYFLSTIISRNFELTPPKREVPSSTEITEPPLISINREHLDTFLKALKKGDVEGAKTLLSVNNYATTIHDTLEFSDSLRHHIDSNHELYHASDRFLKEHLKNVLVPNGNTQELIKLTEEYNQYSLKYYLKKSHPQQVLSMYEGLLQKENFKLSYEYKLVIFCAYIKLNDGNSALRFFISDISSSPEFSLPTFTKSIQSLSNELEYNKVQEILRCHYIQKLSPNSEEFTNYIKRLFSYKTLTTTNSALNLYQKLCDLEVKLNSITYGAFIMGFLSHDKYTEAEFIYNDMIKRGQKPTQVIYNGMLDGFSRRRNVKKIYEIWQQMLDDKIKPDEIAYCAMMETYFKTGESRKAIEIFQQMSLDPKIKLNEIIYNRVIDGLLSNNRVDEAIMVYNQMKNQKITPNIVTYNTLINKLLDKKKEQFAMKVLQDMQQFNITPDVTTLTTILKRQFQNRDVKGVQNVLNMFDSMKIRPNTKTYGTLINGLVNYYEK